MKYLLSRSLFITPLLLGVTTASALANEVTDPLQTPVSSLSSEVAAPSAIEGQVTSVSQLTDVRPTDWAFQALQSLVERYGCIVGYPDRTYRGNQALSRYEFAAGLNACLDRISELIAANTADFVKKEDIDALRKLQEEFAAELATLRGRVDALEARTTTLEKQQFSTTAKLQGEAVFGLAGVISGDAADGSEADSNFVLGYRVRLNVDASFTGEDLLRVRLQSNNLEPFRDTATGTPEGSLRFAAGDGTADVVLDALLYQFKLGERTTVTLEANAGASDDFVPTINPFFDGDGGFGSLTDFGTRNPIYYLIGGAGIGVQHNFTDALSISAGYLAGEPADPSPGAGLFDGPYGAIAQLTYETERFSVGATYVRAYNSDFSTAGNVGSNRANVREFSGFSTSSDAFGLAASFALTEKIVINGSVGYTSVNINNGSGDADIWNWMVGLAFPDLGKKGSVGGILVGMEPRVSNASGDFDAVDLEDRDTSLHVEAFYQFQVNDYIAITPGVIWLTAPDHNNNNDDLFIGVVRATFTF
ncbi:MAG TPA: carbohydrate porin [Leptolyngbyaceae cyanobacterium M33_DOE_097]|uniref:SLH domain-containing protein n=1 Tax=Oscillatoriales cyanobacterium SpSt-418 TaxID=2282169 RepID=A0A7C3KGP5_9CYAN|nr:carbohydrate porin [Leptolyngbyaceae cyanobacterium M33_DOE_097]